MRPTPRRLASMTVPPMLQVGDTWIYNITNLVDQSRSTRTQSIREIRGEEVVWSHGGTGDLMGNYTRVASGNGPTYRYTPSTHHFVFPLRTGAVYDLPFVQENDERAYDPRVKLTVGEEQVLETPAGKLRAIRVHREVNWKRRGKDDAGTNSWPTGTAPRPSAWCAGSRRTSRKRAR